MKKKCEEIESRTRDQRVTLQFLWKRAKVYFYIAGLEEGVFRALQLLQQEVRLYVSLLGE